MYIIRFTKLKKKEDLYVEGNYPSDLIYKLVITDIENIIIISTYSNTIFVPYIVEEYGYKIVETLSYKLSN